MKKLLLTLLVAILTLPSFARDIEYTYEGQTLTYTVIDEDAKTVRTKAGDYLTSGNHVSRELVIPSQIVDGDEKYNVTEIGEYSFSYCRTLTSVIIPNSVTEIGQAAFSGCLSLTSVTIPNSVTEIGQAAFSGCWALTSVTIPDSVTEIGAYAFSRCNIKSVTIPNSVTEIKDYTFYGYKNPRWCLFYR